MTEWQHYPDATLTLPSDGKVTGHARVVFYGDTAVGVITESGSPTVTYRDEDYHVNTRWSRQPDGTWTEDPTNWGHVSSRSRTFATDTPRSYRAKIIEAIGTELRNVWTPDLDRAGLLADVAQDLHRYETTRREILASLAEIDDKIHATSLRLHATERSGPVLVTRDV
jgi:hypothetical protein